MFTRIHIGDLSLLALHDSYQLKQNYTHCRPTCIFIYFPGFLSIHTCTLCGPLFICFAGFVSVHTCTRCRPLLTYFARFVSIQTRTHCRPTMYHYLLFRSCIISHAYILQTYSYLLCRTHISRYITGSIFTAFICGVAL